MPAANTRLRALLDTIVPPSDAAALIDTVEIDPRVPGPADGGVTRAEMAMALCLCLFHDLLARVPDARAYVSDCRADGRRFVFDHGALRTVAWPHPGGLPPGQAAIDRILLPLGYRRAGTYPLDRIGMTGYAWCHADLPETLPQFFVSELHPERFSPGFQAAVTRVVGNTADPLDRAHLDTLDRLAARGDLPLAEAASLLPALARAFGRHHPAPALADYETLLRESSEMAWIATEGHAFNHATDRVRDIFAVAAEQRRLGRPIKDEVEVSASGRVRQTAFRAAPVDRPFVLDDGRRIVRSVPGSFHEIIARDLVTGDDGMGRLDLSFDSGNAQQIFRMTAPVETSRSHEPSRAYGTA